MNVCACGNLMVKSEPWCKRCWAFWNAWYMRVGGRWLEWTPDTPYVCYPAKWHVAPGFPCDCERCVIQLNIQLHVDKLEDRAIRTIWRS